ncbi:tubulin-specific chaperone D-like [Argonauta hians]
MAAVDKDTYENNEEDATDTRCMYQEKFVDSTKLMDMIKDLKNVGDDINSQETSLDAFKVVINRYQEQPTIMDPYLETYINELMSYIKDPNSSPKLTNLSFKHMYLICKMRHHKRIVRYLPHEVTDLPFALKLLQAQNPDDRNTWETRYMLLVWLSIACMIPFDLSRLDAKAGDNKGVMEQIYSLSKFYICTLDKCQDAAIYLLAKFMTRDDVIKKYLSSYLQWACNHLESSLSEELDGNNFIVAIMRNIALILKYGKREDLLKHAGYLMRNFSDYTHDSTGDILVRKSKIQFLQRLGLIFLKNRVASWRYSRGCRTITANLAKVSSSVSLLTDPAEIPAQDNNDNEEYDIPEEIEEIIELLLNGLKDDSTGVRWSAAKGIGRITGRLPKELADEVVETILLMFKTMEGESVWHGGCIALAELGRRGLLLPQRLPEVMLVVRQALIYDVRRGMSSVGSPVRDAACYISWSFARAYEPDDMKPFIQELASSLLIAALFDHRICIRKAASAAFQENVGRQGSFPHGIDIVTVVDYYSVANLKNCYLKLSIVLAQYPEYLYQMIDHLVDIKIKHWDETIRKLTAKALRLFVPFAYDYMAKKVLPKVLKLTSVPDLTTQLGAILAAGEVTYGLAEHKVKKSQSSISAILGETTVDSLCTLVTDLEKKSLFSRVGNELLRETVANYIKNLSLAKLPFHGLPVIDEWQQFIYDCLSKEKLEIQTSALECHSVFTLEYYKDFEGEVLFDKRDQLLEYCITELSSPMDYKRMSHALALGYLPEPLLRGKLNCVLPALCSAAQLADRPHLWAEARRDAVKAINSLCVNLIVDPSGSENSYLCRSNVKVIYATFFDAVEDYSVDTQYRDVGAWVREAAMQGLHDLTIKLADTEPDLLNKDLVLKTLCHLAQQACEKIDKIRALASDFFLKIVYHSPPVPYIPEKDSLLSILPKDKISDIKWNIYEESFPIFTPLLTIEVYAYHVLLGLIQSGGSPSSNSMYEHSIKSIDSYMQSEIVKDSKLTIFRKNLLKIFENHKMLYRVMLPLLNFLGQLLDRQVFSNYCQQPENEEFVKQLVKLTKEAIYKSTQINKILSSIKVFCGVMPCCESMHKVCLKQLGIFLCHRYPKVRLSTASELYDTLLLYDSILPEEHADECMRLIGETKWDQTAKIIRPVRDQLWELMGVPPLVSQGTSSVSSSSLSGCASSSSLSALS